MAKKNGEWLSDYAQFFDTVEINSNYYHPPRVQQVQSWISKVNDRVDGFEYSVKMPGLVIHPRYPSSSYRRRRGEGTVLDIYF